MKSKIILVSLVAIFALVFAIASVSAFAEISSVEINGVETVSDSVDIGTFAGETLPVKVVFNAVDNATDVRLKIWITGDKENSAVSGRFDVISGSTYSRF